jgi:hypothetical protein
MHYAGHSQQRTKSLRRSVTPRQAAVAYIIRKLMKMGLPHHQAVARALAAAAKRYKSADTHK